jgi:hypothetical protein
LRRSSKKPLNSIGQQVVPLRKKEVVSIINQREIYYPQIKVGELV